jgi:hypothetical protein
MASGNRPVLRITARLKDDKSVRFDLGAMWEPGFQALSDEQRAALGGLVLNTSLDKTCLGVKCEPRGGGEPVVLTNDNTWFTLETPYTGGGRGNENDF